MRFLLLRLLLVIQVRLAYSQETIIISDELSLVPIGDGLYIHKSLLQTKSSGKVSCNGLIFIKNNKAILADTPASTIASKQLNEWFKSKDVAVEAIFPTHYHEDCIAGLIELRSKKTKVFLLDKTNTILREKGSSVKAKKYRSKMNYKIGGEQIEIFYPGPGHAQDNVVMYIPSKETLFGGCLVKTMNARKGYLGDASVDLWPKSVQKVKDFSSGAKIVIPGHGPHGGEELLEYTIQLFSKQ